MMIGIGKKSTLSKKIMAVVLSITMVVANLQLTGVTVKAAGITRTAYLDLTKQITGDVGSLSDDGYNWNNSTNTLTLSDGFKINYIGGDSVSALKVKADTTIVLMGSAEINTDKVGIEALGNLTVKTQKGSNGFLKITTKKSSEIGYKYYGIKMQNPEAKEKRTLTVTDNTILQVNGGDNCIMCNATEPYSNEANVKALLNVVRKSVVQLNINNNVDSENVGVAKGFRVSNEERLVWFENTTTNPSLLIEQSQKNIESVNLHNLTMMSFAVGKVSDENGEYSYLSRNNSDNTYTWTYDGNEHPIIVNNDETRLNAINISPIDIVPENFKYYESKYSEYLNDENSDYRDKELESVETQYAAFTAATTDKPKDAARYAIKNNNKVLTYFNISQRKVVINGLKAERKTYDGWADAKIDYSGMEITCVNDSLNDTSGIVASDIAKLGNEIVPYAKAYFTVEYNGADTSGVYVNPFADGKNYKKSADVSYVGTDDTTLGDIAEKMVVIDQGKTQLNVGLVDKGSTFTSTGLSLSDPNYEVVPPTEQVTLQNMQKVQSQVSSKEYIYPRSIEDDTVLCNISPSMVKWREEGYVEDNDITKSVQDSSAITPNHPEMLKTLKANTDYIVNPNSLVIKEVGQYQIRISGTGNYTGVKRLSWSIDRAVREIEIVKSEEKAYDKNPYGITAGKNSSNFYFVINDIDNNRDVTNLLEDGSNLKVMYKGTGSTVYAESLQAPTDAGTYIVTVSVNETNRYTAASKSFVYTIYPKTVSIDWTVSGASVDETELNPSELVYNGTKNIFVGTVNNACDGDDVNVTGVAYNGVTKGGYEYSASSEAPYEAGNFVVKAVGVDNPNYTIDKTLAYSTATPSHEYNVAPAPVYLAWAEDGAVYTYSAKDFTPEATVENLCSNEEGVEDTCEVTNWIFEGKDVFGNDYKQESGVVNVSDGEVTITVTEISNPNYVLSDAEGSLTSTFTVIPRDLSELKVGKWDDEDKEIWAEEIPYSGRVEEPTIIWSTEDGGETLVKEKDYTPSESVWALEYDKNGRYVKITGKGNYTGESLIPWNIDKLPSSLVINNYEEVDGVPYSVFYDEVLDTPDFSFINEDIKKNLSDTLENHLTYRYQGLMKNGREYDSDVVPTEAGEYTLTVTLEETDHYLESVVVKPFVIKQKPIVLSDKVKVVDRFYNGETNAVLDFTNVKITGVTEDEFYAIMDVLTTVDNPEEGYISYDATFEGKDVKWTLDNEYNKVVDIQNVTAGNYSIIYGENTPDILQNFVIADSGNQTSLQGKILPMELQVSGIKAVDKVYDGSKVATLDMENMVLEGVATGEKIKISATAEFAVTGNEKEAEDVRVDEEGNAVAKKVIISNYKITSANANTDIANYTIVSDGEQKETNAIITPADLSIGGVVAEDKVYDGNGEVSLDWNNAECIGVKEGDVIVVNKESELPETASFADGLVEYGDDGEACDKTGAFAMEEIELNGVFEKTNYTYGDVVFKGKILPKQLSGIEWKFNDDNRFEIPEAVFTSDCGTIEGDTNEYTPVVKFYNVYDTEFKNPLAESDLLDNKEYVAKVTATDSGNYSVGTDDESLTYRFVYHVNKQDATLKITNYTGNDGKAIKVEYGETIPDAKLLYNDAEVTEESGSISEKISYRYIGTSLSGKKYVSDEKPVESGKYSVRVTVEETDRFYAVSATADFEIVPATVSITHGVRVVDKVYNGTNVAILNFENANFEGIKDSDIEAVNEILANTNDTFIRYKANYEQKDVMLVEKMSTDGKTSEKIATDMKVTTGNFAFVLNQDTPDVLYNYVIDNEESVSSLRGKILQRVVKVSGITAKDKTYDGNAVATLDTSKAEFAGRIKGEKLAVEVTGKFIITGKEAKAEDVLLDKDGKVLNKKVALTIAGLVAGDENTNADNYCLAEDEQQTEVMAKIRPAELTAIGWSFNKTKMLPEAKLLEAGGIVNGDDIGKLVICIYGKEDTKFKKALDPKELKVGCEYVARVEQFNNANYYLSDKIIGQVYNFTYNVTDENAMEVYSNATPSMNKGLSLRYKGDKFVFKWGKAIDADGYYVYRATSKGKFRKVVKKDGLNNFKFKGKKKVYRAYVEAYKVINGEEIVIGRSFELKCSKLNDDGINAKRVVVGFTNINLATGASKKIKAKVKVVKKGKDSNKTKTLIRKGKKAYLTYWSSDDKIATVSKNGKINAIKKGKCIIYVMARNGKKKKISVTVG